MGQLYGSARLRACTEQAQPPGKRPKRPRKKAGAVSQLSRCAVKSPPCLCFGNTGLCLPSRVRVFRDPHCGTNLSGCGRPQPQSGRKKQAARRTEPQAAAASAKLCAFCRLLKEILRENSRTVMQMSGSCSLGSCVARLAIAPRRARRKSAVKTVVCAANNCASLYKPVRNSKPQSGDTRG